ncbi:MAG: DUF2283 domain-containing protein [Dehalococcoidia bacterium]|nr:DUF2283 domain-containing protein [Dehalococcoidia bacterium]
MRISYDPEADALYISFKKGPVQVTTIRLTEDVAINLGPGEEIFGIEVLDASQHVGTLPEDAESGFDDPEIIKLLLGPLIELGIPEHHGRK